MEEMWSIVSLTDSFFFFFQIFIYLAGLSFGTQGIVLLLVVCVCVLSPSVVSDSLQPHVLKEKTEPDSILGQAANIRLNAWSPSQWILNFVPGVYRNGIPMENQRSQIKEPQDLDLDSPLPKRIC